MQASIPPCKKRFLSLTVQNPVLSRYMLRVRWIQKILVRGSTHAVHCFQTPSKPEDRACRLSFLRTSSWQLVVNHYPRARVAARSVCVLDGPRLTMGFRGLLIWQRKNKTPSEPRANAMLLVNAPIADHVIIPFCVAVGRQLKFSVEHLSDIVKLQGRQPGLVSSFHLKS